MDHRILSGHYAKHQLLSPSRIISFSHRRRFETARRLVTEHAGSRLLDYGSGDGTFAAMVTDLFPNIVGADLNETALNLSRERLGDLTGVTFCSVIQLRNPEYARAFPIVTCMETLEHCVPQRVDEAMDLFSWVLAPGGTLLISVPIEIGPTLLIKQALRTIAGWRGIGDYNYTERYTISELVKMVLARAESSIERPIYFAEGGQYHGHKGFNWKWLRRRLARDFHVTRTDFSPFSIMRGVASSQAWMTCRAKANR